MSELNTLRYIIFCLRKSSHWSPYTRYVQSHQQIVDVFTKPLAKLSFSYFRDKLGVHSIITSSLKNGEREIKQEENYSKYYLTASKFSPMASFN